MTQPSARIKPQLLSRTAAHYNRNNASSDRELRPRELLQLEREDPKINQPQLNNGDPHLDRLTITLLEQQSKLREYIVDMEMLDADAMPPSTMQFGEASLTRGIHVSSGELSREFESEAS